MEFDQPVDAKVFYTEIAQKVCDIKRLLNEEELSDFINRKQWMKLAVRYDAIVHLATKISEAAVLQQVKTEENLKLPKLPNTVINVETQKDKSHES